MGRCRMNIFPPGTDRHRPWDRVITSVGQLEPESAAFLDRLRHARRATQSSPLDHQDLGSVRKSMAALLESCGPEKLPVREVRRQIIGAEGRSVPVQIYWPEPRGAHSRAEPRRPILLYFHGGGWTHFSAQTHDGV